MKNNRVGQLRPVPAHLLPPAQHWARQAQANASAQEHPYSHPDRAPGADIAQKEELVFGPGLAPTRCHREDKGKGKAVCHTRIDSMASDASATTVATASSSMSRTYSSASSASLTESDPEDSWNNSRQRYCDTSSVNRDEPPSLPQFKIPSYVGKGKDAALSEANEQRLRRILPSTIRCRGCAVDLAFTSQIMSKGFTARDGRGYLVSPLSTNVDHMLAAEHDPESYDIGSDEEEFVREAKRLFDESGRLWENAVYQARRRGNNLPNVDVGALQHRSLTTGRHIIADVVCRGCNVEIGWKYIDARELDQLYKVGNFILEANKVAIYRSWEDVDDATVSAIDPSGANTEQQPSSSSSASTSSSSFWASRTAGAIGLADADPLGSVRAINAHHYHRLKNLQMTSKANRDSQHNPPGFRNTPSHDLPTSQDIERMGDVYESQVTEQIRMGGSHHGIYRHRRNAGRTNLRDTAWALFNGYDYDDDTKDLLRERHAEVTPPEIEFDSQDEDECEQLFAGTWDARIVAKQRQLADEMQAKQAAADLVADMVAQHNADIAAENATSEHIER
ncbi:yippee family protein [Ophiostoma piceae UAMH 11346]|uniref:Yippee family protein n=1 Tax=Ophiostoma piceae (strain UAMH 11346) TaxID=1262450 RepID=S3BQR2_OPHP1|nr:yippee family protein [Ophiostoma piceae UAMH 11346]